MSWSVVWKPAALKDLERLDRRTQERINAAAVRLAETDQGDLRKYIEGAPGELGLRVGDWRVFLVYERAVNEIHILRVRPRGRAYR